MAKDKDKGKKPGPVRIANRKARHEYHILEVVECGLQLLGTEVKSLRAGNATLDDAFAVIRGGQAYLVGMTIGQYAQAAPGMQHDTTRDRRLLLHRDRKSTRLNSSHVRSSYAV